MSGTMTVVAARQIVHIPVACSSSAPASLSLRSLPVLRCAAPHKQSVRGRIKGLPQLPRSLLQLQGVSAKRVCRCAVEKESAGSPVREGARREGFRLNSVAWLPLVLAMAGETMTGEIHVDPSMDIFSTFHLSEQFIKHFYVAFICCFSFGCVYFGSLKEPFYDSPDSGYREDGGNGTAHWFYAAKEEEEEAAREQLAVQVRAAERAQQEKEQPLIAEASEQPREPVSSLCE